MEREPDSVEDPQQAGETEPADSEGLYMYGVARTHSWRSGAGEDALHRVRYRDLEALVRAAPFRIVGFDPEMVREHHRRLESSLRRGAILPVPYGLVFRGRRAVLRFIEDQYIALDEGLAFLEGHWELRLHIGGDEDDEDLRDLATRLYSELRRFARAAIPLPSDEGRVLSAAFLVGRAAWIEFVERSDDLGLAHPELTFDVTGPWPPYDFVQLRL